MRFPCVSIKVAGFGLEGGVRKPEAAAGVTIVPTATVTFDFIFARNAPTGAAPRSQRPRAAGQPQRPASEQSGRYHHPL